MGPRLAMRASNARARPRDYSRFVEQLRGRSEFDGRTLVDAATGRLLGVGLSESYKNGYDLDA